METLPLAQLTHRRRRGFAVVFLGLGTALVATAMNADIAVWLKAFLLWSALSAILVGAAYLSCWAGVFGKQSRGVMHVVLTTLLLPFLLITWSAWRLQNWVSKAEIWNEVTPNLFIGRRCCATELPPNTDIVVDLTAEFPAIKGMKDVAQVFYLPVLDGCVPRQEDCKLVFDLMQTAPEKRVYVCCANGCGRSATLVATLLWLNNRAVDAASAAELVKKARPLIALNSDQQSFLKALTAQQPEV